MTDKSISIPEAWIGEDIVVWAGERLEPLEGPLLEVNDRGIVIDNLLNLDELEERIAGGEERGSTPGYEVRGYVYSLAPD
jgi:hypothetical protein